MDIVEPINPSDPSPRQVVFAITASDRPIRTTVVLNSTSADRHDEATVPACAVHTMPVPRLTCLALLERIIGDWARTLRTTLLLTVAVVGLIVLMVVGLGAGGVAIVGCLTATHRLMIRQHRKPAVA